MNAEEIAAAIRAAMGFKGDIVAITRVVAEGALRYVEGEILGQSPSIIDALLSASDAVRKWASSGRDPELAKVAHSALDSADAMLAVDDPRRSSLDHLRGLLPAKEGDA